MATTTLETFFKTLQNLASFDTTKNASRLQQASKSTSAMNAFNPHFGDPYPEQTNAKLDEQDCAVFLDSLAAAAAARGMSALNDDFGFHNVVNNVSHASVCT